MDGKRISSSTPGEASILEGEGSVVEQESVNLVEQETGNVEEQVAGNVVEQPELRRSQRDRKVPQRFRDYVVSMNQNVELPDWRDRVSILVMLLKVFPGQQLQIFNNIMYVISNVQL